jgi:hypothetical protein
VFHYLHNEGVESLAQRMQVEADAIGFQSASSAIKTRNSLPLELVIAGWVLDCVAAAFSSLFPPKSIDIASLGTAEFKAHAVSPHA